MAHISFACLEDLAEIMNFINKNWRNGHVLAVDETLFLHEFYCSKNNRLNIAIARLEENNELVGIFCFLPYSLNTDCDLSGSMWMVLEDKSDEVLLGLKLRKYVIENVNHRFFGTPGPGIQTRLIYQTLRMDWFRMKHYFVRNAKNNSNLIGKFPSNLTPVDPTPYEASICLVNSDCIENFPFHKFSHIAPLKDAWYLGQKYLHHPIHNYHVYHLQDIDKECLFICRIQKFQNSKVYRMVDFIGEENLMPLVVSFLQNYITENDCEYVDFLSHGFDPKIMKLSQWQEVDFESNEIIIPNHFGPFKRDNIPVYCVSDRNPSLKVRFCKADGDQDRPSFYKKSRN